MRGQPSDREVLNFRFSAAEARGECLVPLGRAESRLLARDVEQGVVVRPRNGLYARSSTWRALNALEQHRWIVRALGKKHGDWVFSHVSAAALYGLPVSYRHLDRIHIAAKTGGRASGGIVRHRLKGRGRVERDGTWLTTPEDTILDCATSMTFPEALALADAAVRAGITNHMRLRDACLHRSSKRGVNASYKVVCSVDGRAESGGESIVRAALLECGFNIVDVQRVIGDVERPGHTRRLDLVLEASDGTFVDVEVDGAEKYVDPAMNDGSAVRAMMAERQREAAITALGYRVIRVTPAQALNYEKLIRRLANYGVHPKRVAC